MNLRKVALVVGLPLMGSGLWAGVDFKEAEITTIKNMVEHDPGTGASLAKVNEKIYEKSTVSTAAASMAELMFADSSITRMGANTQFSFRSKERLVKLEQGTILIHTPPGNGGAKVEAGGVTAAVTGTTFMASRDVSGNTMFILLEGQGGLKVTVGGVSTVIRPGQAASIGADSVKEAAAAPSDKGSGQIPAATGGGEDKGKGSGSGPAPTGGGGEGGGTPPPPAAPKIQVFDVDVKKVVSTTPLIVEFKNELPSAAKIEKTVEIQQTAVKEGKLEKLEVEVVAVKNKDGDLLVGAPRVEKEETVVVNKKIDLVAAAKSGDGLDIETAAGPGAGGGTPPPPAPAATTAAAPATALPPPPPPVAPAAVASQIAGSTATTVQLAPTSLNVSSSGGLVQASLDRAAVLGRSVSLATPGLPWLTLSPSTASIPAGATSTGGLAVTLGNASAFFPGWDTSYNLRPINLVATSGDLTYSIFTSDLWPVSAIRAANPVYGFLGVPAGAARMAALDAFFYFQARAAGVTDGPSQYFASLGSTALSLDQVRLNPSTYSLGLYSGQDFDFFAAGNLTAGTGFFNFTRVTGTALSPGMLAQPTAILFGRTVSWDSPGTLWRGLSDPLLDTTSLAYRASLNPDYWTFDGSSRRLGNFAFWDDASSFSGLQSAGGTPQSIDLNLNGLTRFLLAGGSGGVQISGLDLNTGGSSFEVQSAGDLRLKTSQVAIGTGTEVRLEGAGKVKLGAETVSTAPPTVAQAEAEQVRIQATMPAGGSAPNLAILRTANSFEMRNVSISGFSRVQLDGVSSPDSSGNRSVTGRVLLNASAVMTAGATAHLKIREMVGAAVNADSKIQMMALDGTGQLAGTMVAGLEGSVDRVRLPVQGAVDSVSGTYIDTHTVDLAARRVEFQNLNIAAMNSITARANTVLIQNSFMTVVQTGGFINMYVQSGQVNPTYNSVVDGKLNFAGSYNGFNIGGNNFTVSNQTELSNQLGVNILEAAQHLGVPQAGKLNVFSL